VFVISIAALTLVRYLSIMRLLKRIVRKINNL
jgi:hypothetical protein